jgi:biotin-dependent carboxylase-like uncharacterized protein
MITVVKAPPFATIQDLGWATGRAIGVPVCGAMDPEFLMIANLLAGNPRDAAALEWALGPGVLRVDDRARVAVCGDATVALDGRPRDTWQALTIDPDAELVIIPGGTGRFVYVAVQGGIVTPPAAGSRSTYLPAGLGGHEGRRLRAGDRLPIGRPSGDARLESAPAPPRAGDDVLRVTAGPQAGRFDGAARAALYRAEWTVLAASDRMGYRLSGPAIASRERATLPSEAACPGAIQVPDDGQPIVLMPDGPTVGGYPKLAVVARADLALLAQCPPGRTVRFREVSPGEAREALRERERRLQDLERRAIGEGGSR